MEGKEIILQSLRETSSKLRLAQSQLEALEDRAGTKPPPSDHSGSPPHAGGPASKRVASRVVLQNPIPEADPHPSKRPRTREEAARATHTGDEERSRRMFGILRGTLEGFRKEATERDAKGSQRKEVERLAQERAREEALAMIDVHRESVRKLETDKEELLAKLNSLTEVEENEERQMLHSRHEQRMASHVDHFIMTTSTPHIFYKPLPHPDSFQTEEAFKAGQELNKHMAVERLEAMNAKLNS